MSAQQIKLTDADWLAIEREACRRSFWFYRKFMNPKMKRGWWQEEIAGHLQQFYNDLVAGRRPKLVIQAPPQHGKSEQIVDFLAWLAGMNPDWRAIYTSFSERLGIRANLRLQRIFDSEKYKRIFPKTTLNASNVVTISGQYLRNREILEYVGHAGYFRNTTVRGSITGEGMDIGVIDDPIKGREAAGSLTIRDKTWEWLTDDFFTRFSDDAGLLCILTRWHIDDPIGRLLVSMGDSIKLVTHPAIATHDEPNRKAGEALFPEHKSLEFLLERKAIMPTANWEALYQQSPIVVGGELIRGEWFGRYRMLPKIKYRNIYADTANKTKEANDYSVFLCGGLGDDGKLYVIDLIRGKWEAPELRRRCIDFWNKHASADGMGALRNLIVEDAASGTGLIQDMKARDRLPVKGVTRAKDKKQRVDDVLGYIEAGHVMIPDNAPWVSDFLAECEAFTADDTHAHDDQIDPLCDAISTMLANNKLAQWGGII